MDPGAFVDDISRRRQTRAHVPHHRKNTARYRVDIEDLDRKTAFFSDLLETRHHENNYQQAHKHVMKDHLLLMQRLYGCRQAHMDSKSRRAESTQTHPDTSTVTSSTVFSTAVCSAFTQSACSERVAASFKSPQSLKVLDRHLLVAWRSFTSSMG